MCAGEQGSEQDDGLVFLYKLCRGAAPKSYGLQVWACFILLEFLDVWPSQRGSAMFVLLTSCVWLLIFITEQIACFGRVSLPASDSNLAGVLSCIDGPQSLQLNLSTSVCLQP